MCCAYRNVFDLEQAKQQQFAFYAAYFLCTNTKFTIKWCMKNMIRMPFTLHITMLMCHIQMCVFFAANKYGHWTSHLFITNFFVYFFYFIFSSIEIQFEWMYILRTYPQCPAVAFKNILEPRGRMNARKFISAFTHPKHINAFNI